MGSQNQNKSHAEKIFGHHSDEMLSYWFKQTLRRWMVEKNKNDFFGRLYRRTLAYHLIMICQVFEIRRRNIDTEEDSR